MRMTKTKTKTMANTKKANAEDNGNDTDIRQMQTTGIKTRMKATHID